jgi:gentisate 1,2-dioxygenase
MNATANASTARASLKKDATALHLVEFWEQRADVELLQPRNKARPFRWQWTDIEPQLRVTATTVPIEECERRALVFANPGLDGKGQRGEPRLAAALFLSDSSSPSREVEIIAVFASKRFWSQSDISTTKA